MKISNEFTVHTGIDRAWAVLTDLEGIAPCLPGAQLTGVDGDVYSGRVQVRVGPVVSEFAGTARFVERDDAGYRAVIDARGRDARSAATAAASITATLHPDGDATVVAVHTDLKISGKLAQFGSGMIGEVSQKLLGQFVTSLEARIGASEAVEAGAATSTGSAAGRASGVGSGPVGTTAAVQSPGGESTVFATDVTPPVIAGPEVGGPSAAVAAAPSDARGDGTGPDRGTGDNDVVRPTLGTGDVLVTGRDGDDGHIIGDRQTIGTGKPFGGEGTLGSGRTGAGEPTGTTGETGSAGGARRDVATAAPEPLDLVALAGGSVRRRLVPVAAGLGVVAVAVVVWRIVR